VPTDDQNLHEPRRAEGLKPKAATRPERRRPTGLPKLVQSFCNLSSTAPPTKRTRNQHPVRIVCECEILRPWSGRERLPISAPPPRPAPPGQGRVGAHLRWHKGAGGRRNPPSPRRALSSAGASAGAPPPVRLPISAVGQQKRAGRPSSSPSGRATGWPSRPRLGSAGAIGPVKGGAILHRADPRSGPSHRQRPIGNHRAWAPSCAGLISGLQPAGPSSRWQ